MSLAIITGSSGLIGSETARRFAAEGLDVIGIDNDMRKVFFGNDASTAWNRRSMEDNLERYVHCDVDVRDEGAIDRIFARYGTAVSVVVHTAAQPSHDWAVREPLTDFNVNACGTLNLLEACRRHAPDATFIFTSTNKVYGSRPNKLPLIEQETRWEIDKLHPYFEAGVDEELGIDNTLHSLFGVSKTAADLLARNMADISG